MKHLFLIALLLSPTLLHAKDKSWKKYCITETGDTIHVYDSIQIIQGNVSQLTSYISPTLGVNETSDQRSIEIVKWNLYKSHINNMMGGTYPIARLSRAKDKNGEYKPYVVIIDPNHSFDREVAYVIAIDRAIKDGIVKPVKKRL